MMSPALPVSSSQVRSSQVRALRDRIAGLLLSTVALTACSSSGTAVTPSDGGSSSEAGADASINGSSDAGTNDAGPDLDASPPLDSSSPIDSGPNCLPVGATTDSCRTCCADAYSAGSKIFDRYTLQCACAGDLCGPPEAGAPADDGGMEDAGTAEDAAADAGKTAAGDGGLYGNAVCTETCEQQTDPSPACNTCFLSTLGSVNKLGPCGSYVLAKCLADSVCNQYFGCVQNCPP